MSSCMNSRVHVYVALIFLWYNVDVTSTEHRGETSIWSYGGVLDEGGGW